jgi:hypothetical protein
MPSSEANPCHLYSDGFITSLLLTGLYQFKVGQSHLKFINKGLGVARWVNFGDYLINWYY